MRQRRCCHSCTRRADLHAPTEARPVRVFSCLPWGASYVNGIFRPPTEPGATPNPWGASNSRRWRKCRTQPGATPQTWRLRMRRRRGCMAAQGILRFDPIVEIFPQLRLVRKPATLPLLKQAWAAARPMSRPNRLNQNHCYKNHSAVSIAKTIGHVYCGLHNSCHAVLIVSINHTATPAAASPLGRQRAPRRGAFALSGAVSRLCRF